MHSKFILSLKGGEREGGREGARGARETAREGAREGGREGARGARETARETAREGAGGAREPNRGKIDLRSKPPPICTNRLGNF